VSLLVRLHGVEGLQYNLHKMVLGGNQLLEIDRVNAIGVVGLAIALAISCVHHLTG
jgi:hypothetical protein